MYVHLNVRILPKHCYRYVSDSQHQFFPSTALCDWSMYVEKILFLSETGTQLLHGEFYSWKVKIFTGHFHLLSIKMLFSFKDALLIP
jgi:hypothetical protein